MTRPTKFCSTLLIATDRLFSFKICILSDIFLEVYLPPITFFLESTQQVELVDQLLRCSRHQPDPVCICTGWLAKMHQSVKSVWRTPLKWGSATIYISFLNKKWRRFYRQYPWVVNDHWSCHRLGKFSPQLLCLFSIKSQSSIFRLFSCSFTPRAIIWKQDNQMWVDEDTEVEEKGTRCARPTNKECLGRLDLTSRWELRQQSDASDQNVTITSQLPQPTQKSLALGIIFWTRSVPSFPYLGIERLKLTVCNM